MKKIVAIVLALALVFTMSAIAFAATATGDTTAKVESKGSEVGANAGTADAEVLVKITFDDDSIPPEDQPQDPDDVDPKYATYSVTIDASDVVFTYAINDINSYDPATHQYTDGAWKDNKTSGNIVVTNDSNTSIRVGAAFSTAGATKNGVTASLNNTTLDLGSAAAVGAAVSGNVGVSITGVPTVSEDYVLATVVLTITGVEA